MALDKHTIKIRTLTPLWTGNIKGECDKVKETGIIGSLRWWYEALVRGLGGYACDITSDDQREKCDYGRDEENICEACKLFGCTGWSRRFRLEVSSAGNPSHDLFFITSDLAWWLKAIFRNQETIAFGEFGIKLIGEDRFLNPAKAVIFLLAKYGGIGARNQYGFGQFEITSNIEECKDQWCSLKRRDLSATGPRSSNQDLPSMENFFLIKFRIGEDEPLIDEFKKKFAKVKSVPENFNWVYIPVALDLRYKGKLSNQEYFGIRNYFRNKENISESEDNAIFGCVRGNNKNSSKINVSHLYKEKENDEEYFLKIWGILPGTTRYAPGDFADKIRSALPQEFEEIEKITIEEILGDSS